MENTAHHTQVSRMENFTAVTLKSVSRRNTIEMTKGMVLPPRYPIA